MKQNPRYIFKYSNKKYDFRCDKCNHVFNISIAHVSNNKWCSYCNKKKLCKDNNCRICEKNSFKSHKYSDYIINCDPRQIFKHTNKKYTFICENKHLFISRINDITSHNKPTWCSLCKNKTEHKLLDFLKNKFNVKYQFKTNWCINKKSKRYLPFDFYIENLKLIIELDGKQHFTQISNWKSPEITQSTDIYKMNRAYENGISVIRILQEDVLNDIYDWKNELLQYIKLYEKPKFIYLSNNNEYNSYPINMDIEDERIYTLGNGIF